LFVHPARHDDVALKRAVFKMMDDTGPETFIRQEKAACAGGQRGCPYTRLSSTDDRGGDRWIEARHCPGLRASVDNGTAGCGYRVDAALGGKEFKFSLAEALKKGPVVLYFYPKSFTSVCTVEAHEFAENIENFAAAGASVIGLSGDKIEVQRDFSTKECRDKFPVGADPSFSVIKAYDAAFNIPVVGPAFANRISYVISPEGKILYAYSDSNAEKHIENTLAVVRKWREEHKR
jgi:peroxiredoxin